MKLFQIYAFSLRHLVSEQVSPVTMVNNVNVNLPAAEDHENEPITRAEFNQFVDQIDRKFQEILDAIQRLSTNHALGALPAKRNPIACDPEDAMGRGGIPRHRRQDYVEDTEHENLKQLQRTQNFYSMIL